MDSAITALLSVQFILLALMISFLVFATRKVFEYFFKKLTTNHFWNEVFLPIYPILLGGIVGFAAKMYPFPDNITTVSGRVVCGIVAGGLSTTVFRMVQSALKMKVLGAAQQATQAIHSIEQTIKSEQTSQAKPTVDILPTDGYH